MADTMQFDLVSPERNLVSVPVREVRLPGAEGDLTAMPGHAPAIVNLRPGLVTVVAADGTSTEFAVTGGFAGFDLFFTMSNGQPFGATEVPATWIIKQAFDQDQIGYGVALTVILTVVVSLISLVYIRLSERTNVTRY